MLISHTSSCKTTSSAGQRHAASTQYVSRAKESTSKSLSPFESVRRRGGTLSDSMSESNWLQSPPASTMWRSSSVPVKTLNNGALMCMNYRSSARASAGYFGRQQLAHETKFAVNPVQQGEKTKKEKEKLDERQALLIGNNAGVEGELTKQSFDFSSLPASQKLVKFPSLSARRCLPRGVSPEAELKKSVKTPRGVSTHQRRAGARAPPRASPLKSRCKFMGKCWGWGERAGFLLKNTNVRKK